MTTFRNADTAGIYRRLGLGASLLCALLASLALASPVRAATGPALTVADADGPTYVAPGEVFSTAFQLRNSGDTSTSGEVKFVAEYPAGLTPFGTGLTEGYGWSCAITGQLVTCTTSEPTVPGGFRRVYVEARVSPTASSGVATVPFDVSGGGSAPTAGAYVTDITSGPIPFGISEWFAGFVRGGTPAPSLQAGSHGADFITRFKVVSVSGTGGIGNHSPEQFKDVYADLPPGLVGNPTSVRRCAFSELLVKSVEQVGGCPRESQVGLVRLEGLPFLTPVFSMIPPPGAPAAFGFLVSGSVPILLTASLRSEEGYAIRVASHDTSTTLPITGAEFTFWGVPGDPSHDGEHAGCFRLTPPNVTFSGESCPFAGTPGSFLRVPTHCATGRPIDLELNTWEHPEIFHSASAALPPVAGCDLVPFDPTLQLTPTASPAGSPTGLGGTLSLPQPDNPGGLGEADLRSAAVTLPEGVAVNPSSASGLAACSEAQIGFLGAGFAAPNPIHFDEEVPRCPEASKIGTVEIETPLLEHPLPGAIYLARQHENPFGSLLALYLVVDDPSTGVLLKLPGEVSADQRTGQLTATFDDLPQLPFSNFRLKLKSGPRAPLTMPDRCGTYTTHTVLTGWNGKVVAQDSPFKVDGNCATGGFNPHLSAGTQNPIAGLTSPFTLRLTREDGEQELTGITATLPPGLAGYLKGIPYCPDSALAAVSGAEGTGRGQEVSPSCPPASQVGTVTVGAGAGTNPFYTQSGRAYLAGPYRGAPLSLATVVPAVAGPFDLGSVVVRNAIRVDPRTAQLTVVSDPFPTILHGIPLDLRDIRVDVDRSHFTLNPTSCEETRIGSVVSGTGGASASPSERFQVAGCGDLAFKPKLKLRLKGATKRTGHPALKAVVTMPAGGANIARAQVGLPHSEFLDQGNLNKVCRQADLAAGTCPKSSIYGHAKAWSPLLDRPLQGPVYLGVGFGYRLPALVADLNGQIRILLVGRIDTTKRKGIRSTFEVVPDAPVSRFVLTMKGGKKYGLLQNSEDTCRKTQRASALFDAQNGASLHLRPKIANGCGKKAGHRRKGHSRKARK